MEKITLYEENGVYEIETVTASVGYYGELFVTSRTSEKQGSAYALTTVVEKEDVGKLLELMGTDMDGLLAELKSRIYGRDGAKRFRNYCDKYQIKYKMYGC